VAAFPSGFPGDYGLAPRRGPALHWAGLIRTKPHLLLVILPLLLASGQAHAQEAPHAQGSVEARVEFLQDRLDAGERTSTLWWYGWLGVYSALTVGQGAVYFASDDEQLRANALVGGAGSLVAVAATLATSLPSIGAGDDLRRLDGSTPEHARRKLEAGEALLARSAAAEASGRSWVSHGLGFVLGAAQGAVLWLAYDLPVDGAISFGVSVAMSEVQIFTQPTRAIDDEREYRARVAPLTVSLFPVPGGAGLRLRF
jgi:hypothetical protein